MLSQYKSHRMPRFAEGKFLKKITIWLDKNQMYAVIFPAKLKHNNETSHYY